MSEAIFSSYQPHDDSRQLDNAPRLRSAGMEHGEHGFIPCDRFSELTQKEQDICNRATD